jgi:RNA polymerase sigma factor, sigma-70 family
MNLLEQALAAYRDNYAALCVQACGITGNAQDAEDVMQAVLLHLLECPERITSARNLRSFLQIAVRNRALDLLRRQGRHIPMEESAFAQISSESATRQMDEMLCALALRKCLAGQPEALREAFIAHVLYDARIKELANELGVTPNTLSQQFRRIKKSIRASLAKEAGAFDEI